MLTIGFTATTKGESSSYHLGEINLIYQRSPTWESVTWLLAANNINVTAVVLA